MLSARTLVVLAFGSLIASCGGGAIGRPDGSTHPDGAATDTLTPPPPPPPPPVDGAVPPPPPPPPPPVDAGGAALGAPCAADSECSSGVCIHSPNILPGGCGQPCVRDNDCVAIPTAGACVLERPSDGAPRWVCAAVDGPQNFPGDRCTRDLDCASNVCVDSVCRQACAASADCSVGGMSCATLATTGGMVRGCGADPVSATTVETFTVYNDAVDVDTGATVPFWLPPDVVSFELMTQDLEGRELLASVPRLTAPDNTVWIDGRNWSIVREQPLREILVHQQVNSVLAPSSNTLAVQHGRYEAVFSLFNDTAAHTMVTSRRMRGMLFVKRAPSGRLPATGQLQLRLWFVGAAGITSTTAATNTRLQNALTVMQRTYAQVGISVVVQSYNDVTGADAARLSTIDSQAEMQDLFVHSGGDSNTINLFFVNGISASAGLEGAIGVAGDIVGPPGIGGTIASGVIIGWGTTGPGSNVLGQVMAHETGHYLGLWHVRESQPACATMTQMNCSFWGGVDPITDTPSDDASGSAYMMYWSTSDGRNTSVSPGEGVVMRSNVVVR